MLMSSSHMCSRAAASNSTLHPHLEWTCLCVVQTVDEDRVIASFVKAVRDQAGHVPHGSSGGDDEYDYEYSPSVY